MPLPARPALTRQHVYNRQGMCEWATKPQPAGDQNAGEREMLDDSKFFEVVMVPDKDKLFADGGYFGYPMRHRSHQFCLPTNRSANVYTKAKDSAKRDMEAFDARHKRLALSFVEHCNREVRRFRVVAKETKFRHGTELFEVVHRHVLALTNARLRRRLRDRQPPPA